MKQKRWLLSLGIILVIGMGIIIFFINYNKVKKVEESNKIVESYLPITGKNFMQTSTFLGSGFAVHAHLSFFLYYEDTGFEAVLWNEYGSLFKNGEENPCARRWEYPEGEKAEIMWWPINPSPDSKNEYEKSLKDDEISLNMDHYLYVMLKQKNHITGLIVMKFPVDNETFQEIKILGAIQFEKQNGEYQKVTEEYIQKRVGEIIEEYEEYKT